ncbi:PPM family protein phosphatase [Frankia sp. AiPs1]|uniref:protein phosphatase 2C domain-containing protein n=1 Tax=Frankia sp. AiPa1 TaxID=573492 RepID=UPI00202B9657|nr:protein phosphatase 2C domain-containing protein [Frankia sp. AiPa1]MCL9759974.1 serine/threonine-protein phosphatase [Frankia sp. AiPa1]
MSGPGGLADRASSACPSCGEEALAADRFCEACGAALHTDALHIPVTPLGLAAMVDAADAADPADPAVAEPAVQPGPDPGAALSRPEPCAQCQGVVVDAEGYCLTCGLQRSRPGSGRPERTEFDLGPLAGVSDRGLVHQANEDAMAASEGSAGALIAVVCDGVSRAVGSGPGARAAAAAALASLARAAGPAGDAIRAAAGAGQAAIEAVAASTGDEPSCTFAAALYAGGVLTVGWLGDSRVYLLDQTGPQLLTFDDTVAAAAAREGLIPPEAAETAPGAHTITSWLGLNSRQPIPHVRTAHPVGPGRVLVCTDGLWNDASSPGALAAQIAELPGDASAAETARHLVAAALRAGGRDNITVVVMDIPGRA